MRQLLPYIVFLLPFLSCSNVPKTDNEAYTLVFEEADSLRLLEVIKRFSDVENYELDNIACEFLGTPYAAHTLESGSEEQLVINLHEFDCTTFVETCLALQQTLCSQVLSFEEYTKQLKRIRYRNDELAGYVSRLHYFTDWIDNNIHKGLVQDVTEEYGGIPYPNTVNFMSKHAAAYQQLKADTSLVKFIAEIESKLSEKSFHFIPKEKVASRESQIESGLIVAFTTNIAGLDVVHNGITTRIDGKLQMIHASLDGGQVVVTDKQISDYISENRLQSGIILIKPVYCR